ncbi:MAG TPA: UbiA family prenyltransferase [Candidatus Binatia bacterium]|nr:UbiA family prenyltransferase [Candidatus Binatia bacterium]
MADQSNQDHSSKGSQLPLVVDLDSTLTPTDTLIESIIQVVKQSPLNLLRLPFWLLKGRAAFKDSVAAHASFSAKYLPYRESLLTYLRNEKEKGRRIILATAAHKSIARAVSEHLGLFDEVLATETGCNLKGKAKLEAIQERIGGDFVYAGDSHTDRLIWKAAMAGILVAVAPHTVTAVRRQVPIEHQFPKESPGFAVWLRLLRVHQWPKNLLVFVPLLTSFSFMEIDKLALTTLAYIAFSFAASATYIVNDLLDLENDRAHPRKCQRPFASARLPIMHGLAVAGGALFLAFVMALAVSKQFLAVLLLYLAASSTYSWRIKGYVLVDVLMLSVLYTLRILAGSAAVSIAISSWLLAFSVFIFMSLALLKRCAELVSLETNDTEVSRGRDYRKTDLVVLWPLGVGTALSAVVVFGLFISAPETQARYAAPNFLWLLAIGLTYWLARLWVKTSRGEIHDDPVVYALKDRASLVIGFSMIVVMLIAHGLPSGSVP